MVPTKKSDRLIGFLGILQALLLIWIAQLVIEDAIALQDMTNEVKVEIVAEFDCESELSDSDCEKIIADFNGWVDGVQSDIVIWQVLYAFVGIVGVLFLLISFRLMTGTEILLNSLFTNQNRSLFFYSTLFIIVIGYAIGMFEAHMLNSMMSEMHKMFEEWEIDMGEKPEKIGVLDNNAAVIVYGNAIFLLFNGLIGLLTRGPINGAETAVPAEVKEISGETELDDLLPPE
jgi:uncharacterized protein YacL